MPKQIVYVHGAGPQKPAATLKHDIDMALFGKDMSTSRLAFYANVRWPSAGTPAGPAVAAVERLEPSSSKPRRSARPATPASVPPTQRTRSSTRRSGADSGRRRWRRPRGRVAGSRGRRERSSHSSTGGPTVSRATSAAAATSGRQGRAMGIYLSRSDLPLVVGMFASDVIDYLYGPFKRQMRRP